MVKNIITQFMRVIGEDEATHRMMATYKQSLGKPELEFLRTTLLTIKGLMAQNLLSKWATTLPRDEKEIMIHVYYNLNNLIDFLLAPEMSISARMDNNGRFN